MKYEIVELKEMLVEGIATKTCNMDADCGEKIGNLWKQFFEDGVYQQIQNKVNEDTIGLYTEYEGDYKNPYTFMCGCEVNQKPTEIEGKVIKTIPAGKYAMFMADSMEQVGLVWQTIWETPLDRTYLSDFELYHMVNGNQQIKIYVSLR